MKTELSGILDSLIILLSAVNHVSTMQVMEEIYSHNLHKFLDRFLVALFFAIQKRIKCHVMLFAAAFEVVKDMMIAWAFADEMIHR